MITRPRHVLATTSVAAANRITMPTNNECRVKTNGASQEDTDKADIRMANATDSQRSLKRPRLSSNEVDIGDITKSYVEQEKVLLVGEDGKFVVHAHKVKEFAKFDEMLENAAEEAGLKVIKLSEKGEHITEVLEVLYAPAYTAELLDTRALLTALAFAAEYQHPSLRAYAIKVLEGRQEEISPLTRIKFAQGYDISEWVPKAIDDLSERESPITLEEANELGPETFATVSKRREKASYNKGLQAGRVAKKR
ncbi:hypothetical protein FRC08_011654 [Ceratobasidium sp. 394]|nr:hypothetical protein FRC08_011654 [Ceratobasidium sp. 394]